MTPLLAQTAVVLLIITLLLLLLMGFLLWLQRQAGAKPDRQSDAPRPRLSRRRTGGHPPPMNSSNR